MQVGTLDTRRLGSVRTPKAGTWFVKLNVVSWNRVGDCQYSETALQNVLAESIGRARSMIYWYNIRRLTSARVTELEVQLTGKERAEIYAGLLRRMLVQLHPKIAYELQLMDGSPVILATEHSGGVWS